MRLLQVSLIAIIEAVAFSLLRMPLGALADRLEGRRLMIIADVGRTLLTLAIPIATAAHADTLTVIYVVIGPIEAFSALFDSASNTAVPMLVTDDRRGMAYAWQESFESVAWVVGPPLGGVLAVAFGTGKALGLDSASFLVSVAGLLAIRQRFASQPGAVRELIWASMRSGLRLMIADRVLRRDQLIWSLYSILGGSIVLGLVYVATSGGRDHPALATLAVAAYAAGSAAGTLLAGRFEHAPGLWLAEAAALAVAAAAAGAALLAVGGVPAIIAGGALFGLGEGLLLVFHLTLRARATPDGYFGRITGVAGVARQITGGLSMVWLGLVLRFAPGRAAFVILAAAAAALAAAIALASKPPLPPAAPQQDQDQDHPDIERTLVPPDPSATL